MWRSTSSKSIGCMASYMRCFSSFDALPLTHSQMIEKYYTPSAKCEDFQMFFSKIEEKLESFEKYILRWRKGKWSFRVSNLITSSHDRQCQLEQVDILREKWKSLALERQQAKKQYTIIKDALNLKGPVVNLNVMEPDTQNMVEKHVASLRWEGRVDEARELRDAWRYLESDSTQAFKILLERMCCLYGLMKNNAFTSAFTNVIERSAETGKIVLNKANPYDETARLLVTNVPVMDIYYAFLGFQPHSIANENGGYGEAIGKYLAMNLMCKYESMSQKYQSNLGSGPADQKERILFSTPTEALFYSNLSGESHWPNSNTPRYLHFRKTNASETCAKTKESSGDGAYIATLILVASENPHERRVQLPELKEREGIARRLAFVLGVHPDNVRLRILFLPPTHLDTVSIERMTDVLDGKLWAPEFQCFEGYYAKELESSDVDFAEQRKKMPQEDWREL